MFRRVPLVLVGSLMAGALTGCPSSDPPPRPRLARSTPQPELPHAWPPAQGAPFPSLELLDREGNSIQLASLAGKVLLIEPVGISCPACQAFSGGDVVGGFRGGQPEAGLPSMASMFAARGVDPAHPDLVVVQLLFYDMSAAAAPTVADARDWAAHFGFDQFSNVLVLVGDERYVRQETYDLVPGFFLVDRDGVVVGDATGHSPQESYGAVFDRLATLLGAGEGPPFVMPADPFAVYPELAERAERGRCREDMAARRFEALEQRLQALRAAGRRPGDVDTLFDLAIGGLAYGENERVLPLLDAWCEARPGSALPHLARGNFLIAYAWEARGGGYANTVSEDGWRLFHDRLARSRADLERAAALDPTLASAYSRLITVGMGLQLTPAEGQAFFEKAVRADPTYVDAYTRQLTSILPKWGGDEEAMWAFVKASQAAQPGEPALHLLTVEAHMEQARMGQDRGAYLRKADVRAALDAAHDAMSAAYPLGMGVWLARQQVVSLRKERALTREARLKRAEAGAPRTQLEVACDLYGGSGGFRRDRPRAAELALRAAHHDITEAMVLLGIMLHGGEGVAKDVVSATRWLRLAADRGNEQAMIALGEVLGPDDREEALARLQRATESLDPEVARVAQAQLAKLTGAAR